MALSKGCTIHFTLVAAEMVVLLIRGVVDFLRARCLSKRGVSATNDARKKNKKLALTRFELARFPITDWSRPKRDAITTRPQYHNNVRGE